MGNSLTAFAALKREALEKVPVVSNLELLVLKSQITPGIPTGALVKNTVCFLTKSAEQKNWSLVDSVLCDSRLPGWLKLYVALVSGKEAEASALKKHTASLAINFLEHSSILFVDRASLAVFLQSAKVLSPARRARLFSAAKINAKHLEPKVLLDVVLEASHSSWSVFLKDIPNQVDWSLCSMREAYVILDKIKPHVSKELHFAFVLKAVGSLDLDSFKKELKTLSCIFDAAELDQLSFLKTYCWSSSSDIEARSSITALLKQSSPGSVFLAELFALRNAHCIDVETLELLSEKASEKTLISLFANIRKLDDKTSVLLHALSKRVFSDAFLKEALAPFNRADQVWWRSRAKLLREALPTKQRYLVALSLMHIFADSYGYYDPDLLGIMAFVSDELIQDVFSLSLVPGCAVGVGLDKAFAFLAEKGYYPKLGQKVHVFGYLQNALNALMLDEARHHNKNTEESLVNWFIGLSARDFKEAVTSGLEYVGRCKADTALFPSAKRVIDLALSKALVLPARALLLEYLAKPVSFSDAKTDPIFYTFSLAECARLLNNSLLKTPRVNNL